MEATVKILRPNGKVEYERHEGLCHELTGRIDHSKLRALDKQLRAEGKGKALDAKPDYRTRRAAKPQAAPHAESEETFWSPAKRERPTEEQRRWAREDDERKRRGCGQSFVERGLD